MTTADILSIIIDNDITRRIFYHLTSEDLANCALVSKAWLAAVQDGRLFREVRIDGNIIKELNSNKLTLDEYINKKYKYVPNMTVQGWLPEADVPGDTYDNLFKHKLQTKRLTLKGRGQWSTCRCPKTGSSCGEQIVSIDVKQITKLESIYITSTFRISACALLDLISRSPKLKSLRFFGILEKCDHTELFNLKHFLSNLDCLCWPIKDKSHVPVLATIVKRNENITTFYSSGLVTCDLLASESLPNLKFLSLLLNEKWVDNGISEKKNLRRAARYLSKINYLSSAKKVEGLEVRTFDAEFEAYGEEGDISDFHLKIEPTFEQYKISFWDQIARLPKLKYLSIHGSWELNEVCRELAKHDCRVEYLKIGLLPESVHSALLNDEDSPILSMVDGARNLKKLSRLKSLWFVCFEKLGSIDDKTAEAINDLKDLIWIADVKVVFTEEVEGLLNIIMRRGKQLGKTYKIHLHIQPKELDKSSIVAEHDLKFPMGTNLRDKLTEIADSEISARYGRNSFEAFQIWGLEQIDNTRDKMTFERLKTAWTLFEGKFKLTSPWYNST